MRGAEGIRCWMGVLLLMAGTAWAEPRVDGLFGPRGATIEVAINKSHVITLEHPVKRVSVGNPEVADLLMPAGSRQVYVVGKSIGTTNVVLWESDNRISRSFDVEVTPDLQSLKRKLHDLLPDEDVRVTNSQGAIVLSGQVSSAERATLAADLARSYAPPPKDKNKSTVLNQLTVGGAQQVMLEVQVAEMNRNLTRQLGINFHSFGTTGHWSLGAVNGGATIGGLQPPNTIMPPLAVTVPGGGAPLPGNASEIIGNPLTISDKGLLFSFMDGKTLFNAVIEAAQQDGLAKVLAEPTLTTLTGQEAKFHAGGEFPIPVSQSSASGGSTVTIQFKEFGIGLGFLPVVLESGKISLKVSVAVSELSNANAVTMVVPNTTSLFVIPSLTSRSASSSIELGNGQTMAIAGLISESLRDQVQKFPGLGDVPLLGYLFRSQSFIKGQTELVILVTPHFAKPNTREAYRLPTDSYVEPSGAEYYLMGRMEGAKPAEGTFNASEMQGSYGHAL